LIFEPFLLFNHLFGSNVVLSHVLFSAHRASIAKLGFVASFGFLSRLWLWLTTVAAYTSAPLVPPLTAF